MTLRWAFALLCTRLDIQKKIQQELDAFVSKHKRLPTFSEREAVPYLIAVQKECLRFRPATPCGAPHLVQEDGDIFAAEVLLMITNKIQQWNGGAMSFVKEQC